MKTYTQNEDLWFDSETDQEAEEALLKSYRQDIRITVTLGDTSTGRVWEDFSGWVTKSKQNEKVLLLQNSRRSIAGYPLPTADIIRIRYADKNKGGDLYDISTTE